MTWIVHGFTVYPSFRAEGILATTLSYDKDLCQPEGTEGRLWKCDKTIKPWLDLIAQYPEPSLEV
jgi:hypothetical protein